MPTGSRKIVLVVPPFTPLAFEPLGATLLAAIVEKHGYESKVLHLNLQLADRLGVGLYQHLNASAYFDPFQLGEYVFSHILNGHDEAHAAAYLRKCWPNEPLAAKPLIVGLFMDVIEETRRWVKEATEEILALNPFVVGFSSSFDSLHASLLLAREIKARRADVPTILGGQNTSMEWGPALISHFNQLDFVVQGEADLSFPELLASLNEGAQKKPIPGVLTRDPELGTLPPVPASGETLDALPYPKHEEYVTALSTMKERKRIMAMLVMETSRGCAWGRCHFCATCKINSGHRSKSPDRVYEEMVALHARYPDFEVSLSDDCIPKDRFDTLFPRLAKNPLSKFFFETMASNLTRENMQTLRRARITGVAAGLESISDNALKAMNKYMSAAKVVEVMKWAHETKVQSSLLNLHNVPGSDPETTSADYERILPLLAHLGPFFVNLKMRIYRFSNYGRRPEEFGLAPLRLPPPTRDVFGDLSETLAFESYSDAMDSPGLRKERAVLGRVVRSLNALAIRSFFIHIPRKRSLVLVDTRPCAVKRFWRLRGLNREIYEYCAQVRTHSAIRNRFSAGPNESEVESTLSRLVEAKLVLASNDRFIALSLDARTPGAIKPPWEIYDLGAVYAGWQSSEWLRRALRKRAFLWYVGAVLYGPTSAALKLFRRIRGRIMCHAVRASLYALVLLLRQDVEEPAGTDESSDSDQALAANG